MEGIGRRPPPCPLSKNTNWVFFLTRVSGGPPNNVTSLWGGRGEARSSFKYLVLFLEDSHLHPFPSDSVFWRFHADIGEQSVPPLNLLFAMRLKKLSPALSFTRFPPHSLSFHCEIVSRPLLIFWFSNQIKTKNNTLFDLKFWMRFLSFIMKFPLSNFNFKSLGSGVMGSHLQLHKFST